MTHPRPRLQSGGRHRRGAGAPTFRPSTLSATAAIWIALLVFCCADAEVGSVRVASPTTLSRLMAAAARARDPAREARVRWELARVLRDAGRSDEAIVEYRKTLALDGSLGEARRELAQLLRARGRPSEAAEEYARLLRGRPGHAALRRELAESWLEAKQEDRAIVELEHLVAGRPSDLSARRRVIELYEMRGRWTEVITSAQSLLATAPDDPQVRLHLARALIASQRAAEAIPHLKQLVRMQPGHREGTRLLAEALSWQGEHQEAIGLFREVLRANPADRTARIGLAQALSWAERHGEAIAEFEQVIRADPSNAEALEGLGAASVAAQMPYRALEVYRRAVALQPKRREARLGVALALGVAGEYVAARGAYADILAEDPKEARVWLGTAELLTWAGRYDEAEGWYLEALQRFPDDPSLLLGYARMLLAGRRFAEAADSVGRAAQKGADETAAALLGAEALRHVGRSAEADELLGRVAARRPGDPRALVARGELALRRGDVAAAATEFRHALAIKPSLIGPRYGLWKAEREGKIGVEGSVRLMEALVSESSDPFTLARMGELLAADGRFAQGAEACADALAANPDLVPARFTLAEAAAAQGDFGRSAGAYRGLLEWHPENIKARVGLARVLSWSQRYADAVAEYDRILGLDPRNPLARRERARVLGWAQRFAEAREGYDRILREPPSGPAEPLRRLPEKIRLEREIKEALWIGRYATAADLSDRLLRLEPGNEEARFDRAQTLSQLGLWRSAELAYLELLALDPFHRQAAIARERAWLEQRPRGQIQYEFFESRGRGTLADIRRQKVSTSAGLPLAADGAILTAEYAHTFFPIGDFDLDAYSLRLEGRLGRQLTGLLRATHNDYLAPLRSKQNYEARLDYRLLDRATLTLNYRREDVHENRESLSQQIQRDFVTVKGEMPLSVRDAVGAAYSYARYSDDNERQAFELFGSHQFSLYPRVLKLTYTLSYQDFSRGTIFPPEGSSVPTVHPYFAPSNFFTNALTLEWRHYLQKELFLGANQCYYDLQWTPAVESIDAVFSNTVRGEVLCDLTRRFTVSVQGLISRSTTYEAEQLSLQLLYRF